MSASRTVLLASRSRTCEGSDEYDSEEERYQRKRRRLYKKVEESAAAIRTITEITRPFFTGSWRLEREEELERQQKLLDERNRNANSLVGSLTPSRESNHSPLKKTSDLCRASLDDNNGNISTRTPLKTSRRTSVSSFVEMEKTPTWTPLRKSKARHSLALFSTENKCEPLADKDDDPSIACQPLNDGSNTQSPLKTIEEARPPLSTVVSSNQTLEGRKSISSISELPPTASSSDDIGKPVGCNRNLDFKSHNDMSAASPPLGDCELQTPVKRLVKDFKSPVRISPILLQAFGEERARVRGSIGSPDKVLNLDECTTKDPSKVLKDVVAYVEVRRGEDDRTSGFRWKLNQLGATVSDTLNKKVTHVIFQEGLLSTFRKAKQIGAHIVSTHWVMACDESFTKVKESRYPIEKLSQYELADPFQKTIKRPKIMSPDLGSGRDDKALNKRLQRQSIRVNSPLTLVPAFSVPVIKTPSPVKSRFRLQRSSLFSPTSKDPADGDSVDDYDGFLAMVEAQVREKAELRKKDGNMNGPPLDFETRLQLLLGRTNEDSQGKQQNLPLASIFQKRKASTQTTAIKKSPKKGKNTKSNLPPAAPSSVMMNWLQRCSPETGHNRESSSVSAAAAASAAADEILDSMFKTSVNSKFSKLVRKPHIDEANKNNDITESVTKTSPKIVKYDTKTSEDIPEKPFVFTAILDKNRTKKPHAATKPAKGKKADFHGKGACAHAMRSWLMREKSPPVSTTTSSKGSSMPPSHSRKEEGTGGGNQRVRKVNSFDEVTTSDVLSSSKQLSKQMTPKKKNETSCEDDKPQTVVHSPRLVNILSKKKAGERTPSKKNKADILCPSPKLSPNHSLLGSSNLLQQSPLKTNGSASKSRRQKIESTPRRRSLRLTPIKVTSQVRNITELETLQER